MQTICGKPVDEFTAHLRTFYAGSVHMRLCRRTKRDIAEWLYEHDMTSLNADFESRTWALETLADACGLPIQIKDTSASGECMARVGAKFSKAVRWIIMDLKTARYIDKDGWVKDPEDWCAESRQVGEDEEPAEDED